jgi:hypothetical protein
MISDLVELCSMCIVSSSSLLTSYLITALLPHLPQTHCAKAALGPFIDGFTCLIYGLVACGVFCSENMIDRRHFEVEVQGCDARLMFQHLDIRRLVCACDGSETLVLHCLEWIDQSVSVGSFISE